MLESRLKRRVLPDNLLYSPFICRAVFLKEIVRVGLGRGFGVGIVKQILNAQKNLLYGNRGFPGFFFVQDRETHGTGRIDVGMKKRRCELA